MVEIKNILLHLLNWNEECVDMILRKKNIIERNETLFYHIERGIEHGYLISYPKDNEYFVSLKKVSCRWSRSLTDRDCILGWIRGNTKILVECLSLQGFIKTRIEGEDYWYLREGTFKEKINAINTIFENGVEYLELIKGEYENNDILHAVILTNEGRIESIMGGVYSLG